MEWHEETKQRPKSSLTSRNAKGAGIPDAFCISVNEHSVSAGVHVLIILLVIARSDVVQPLLIVEIPLQREISLEVNPEIIPVFPAMLSAPKEFTEDWISTFDIEKIAPWKPAGRPSLIICISLFLYILSLECGDPEPRQIVSSIVPFYKAEELLNQNIVLVYNLKPANFRGVRSNGMLLAASDANESEKHETCEVLFAPQFEPGTILEPEGFEEPAEELCYVKPDKFFEMPMFTKDGFVEIDGKKIGKDGVFLQAHKYVHGTVG